jgi:hypothetical protein
MWLLGHWWRVGGQGVSPLTTRPAVWSLNRPVMEVKRDADGADCAVGGVTRLGALQGGLQAVVSPGGLRVAVGRLGRSLVFLRQSRGI